MQKLEEPDDKTFKKRLELCVQQPFEKAVHSLVALIKTLADEKIQPASISAKFVLDVVAKSIEIRVSDIYLSINCKA